MTVLIAGAGIAGLTLALSLERIGVPVQIYEAVREIRPLGVGINLQPHAVRELDELGLLENLDAIGLRTQEVAYFSSHGQKVWAEPRGLSAGYDWPQFSVHRGELQMMLLEAVRARLGSDAVRTGVAVEGWQQVEDRVEVDLRARPTGAALGTARGSIFVAADGIHSAARAALYPDEGLPSWGGIVMWRGITRGPRFLTGRTMAMAGCKPRKFVCYPIEDIVLDDGTPGSLINWIADLRMPEDHLWRREDWNRPGDRTDFLPRFADWQFDWLDVPSVIGAAEAIYEYPMVDRDPLPRWTHGPMTLMGDAAHPMYPIGSNGASQAILDARVLTREILRHGANEFALIDYEAERRPATERIVLANRADGPDAILDVVEERAPEGFLHIHEVLSRSELEDAASGYKKLAGFDVDGLNRRAPIVPPDAILGL
jgi:2-polyprenyl-6-methoxyphenol hydroxylase-like FAD-dependent oxidoreductase